MNDVLMSKPHFTSENDPANGEVATQREEALSEQHANMNEAIATERKREIAVEHLLFQTIGYVERIHPGLLAHLEASLSSLGDPARDDSKDDGAVRDIAHRFLRSLRSGAG